MTRQSLDIKGIGKSFGGDDVLKGIDISVRAGEFISLVGMSGCGKSTLLRIIAGLERPDRGQIMIGETDVTGMDPSDRNLAMVFQSYALYPHMTVRDNIATPLRMRKLSLSARMPLVGRVTASAEALKDIDASVIEAAETLQIAHLLDRKPARLSGGQRQRVALARALVRSPAAFLMDEPLSNLDAKLRAHMRDELANLHRRLGATFVYVTHDQVEAMTMSNRIALMSEGRIEQLGTPSDLYQRPANLTVARFIGSPAINLIPVEIASNGAIGAYGRDLGIAAARSQAGQVATLGIRAEDLVPAAHGLQMQIERIEMHGADRYVHASLIADASHQLTMRLAASEALPAGDDGILTVGFRADRTHLFAADGQRMADPSRRELVA